MRIGLISDTHTPSTGPHPPAQVALAFQGVDLILHAGDIHSVPCLDWLERIAPVLAVETDVVFYWDGDPRVAPMRVMELEGYTLGLVHELFLPGMAAEPFQGVIPTVYHKEGSLDRALRTFFGRPVDIAVYGHLHEPVVERHQGVLLVNPGSPTLPHQIRRLGTVGILELTPQGPQTQIVDLASLT